MSSLGFALGGPLGGDDPLDVTADQYAGMLFALLPPGRLWRFVGSLLTDVLTACGDELERLGGRMRNLLDEADPRTADELLPDHERELDLPSDGTPEERQARIEALLLSQQGYRPADFQSTLAPLLGQVSADVVVLERTHAAADAMGDDREIKRFFVYRDPTAPGVYYLDSAQQLVDKIKRSTTIGYVIESVDFCCDDEFSLCDRDLLGA